MKTRLKKHRFFFFFFFSGKTHRASVNEQMDNLRSIEKPLGPSGRKQIGSTQDLNGTYQNVLEGLDNYMTTCAVVLCFWSIGLEMLQLRGQTTCAALWLSLGHFMP